MAIAPCAAKVVSTSMVRVSNGSYQLALQHDHAHHAIAGEHGDTHHRPYAAELDGLVPLVRGVAQDVADPDDAPLQPDAPYHRAGGGRGVGAGE